MITATALAIAPIIRLGAAATLRKLQRVAIQQGDQSTDGGTGDPSSGAGDEGIVYLCGFGWGEV